MTGKALVRIPTDEELAEAEGIEAADEERDGTDEGKADESTEKEEAND